MAIRVVGAGPRWVWHPPGEGAGALFHPRVNSHPPRTVTGVGAGILRHPRVPRRARRIKAQFYSLPFSSAQLAFYGTAHPSTLGRKTNLILYLPPSTRPPLHPLRSRRPAASLAPSGRRLHPPAHRRLHPQAHHSATASIRPPSRGVSQGHLLHPPASHRRVAVRRLHPLASCRCILVCH